jgi:hypothetical protein
MGKRRSLAVLLLLSALGLWSAAPAGAMGTVRVMQHDGTIRYYTDVTIHFRHDRLRLISHDGKGAIVIDRAACSYIGDIERCLPIDVMLDQDGALRPMDLAGGTIFVNNTDAVQELPLSSKQIPPHGILLSIKTKRGTYISLAGAIDEVVK